MKHLFRLIIVSFLLMLTSCDTISEDSRKIIGLEYTELTLAYNDGGTADAISISPDGKYALSANDLGIQIFEHVSEGDYQFVRKAEFSEESLEIETTQRVAFSNPYGYLRSEYISWSNNCEYFTFSGNQDFFLNQMFITADIYICDVKEGIITNLTGRKGQINNILGETTYGDYSPVFSKDDNTIYFARWGSEIIPGTETEVVRDDNTIHIKREVERIHRICSVSVKDGSVKDVYAFEDTSKMVDSDNTLFIKGDTLYFGLANLKEGYYEIFKLSNGKTNLLVSYGYIENADYPHLHDLSGDKLLFIRGVAAMQYSVAIPDSYTPGEAELKLREMVKANILDLNTEELVELSHLSSKTSGIRNAILSPNGRHLLQIEYDNDGDTAEDIMRSLPYLRMYIVDTRNPDDYTLVYSAEYKSNDETLGTPSLIGNISRTVPLRKQIQPTWLSNGYIAMNSFNSGPFLLKVIYE